MKCSKDKGKGNQSKEIRPPLSLTSLGNTFPVKIVEVRDMSRMIVRVQRYGNDIRRDGGHREGDIHEIYTPSPGALPGN